MRHDLTIVLLTNKKSGPNFDCKSRTICMPEGISSTLPNIVKFHGNADIRSATDGSVSKFNSMRDIAPFF